MSQQDYMMGQQQGAFLASFATDRAVRSANDAHAELADWKRYANQLKSKVEETEKKAVFKEADYVGEAAALKMALDELRRVSPNSPLLDPNYRRNVKANAMVPAFAKYGYTYDPVNYKVTK